MCACSGSTASARSALLGATISATATSFSHPLKSRLVAATYLHHQLLSTCRFFFEFLRAHESGICTLSYIPDRVPWCCSPVVPLERGLCGVWRVPGWLCLCRQNNSRIVFRLFFPVPLRLLPAVLLLAAAVYQYPSTEPSSDVHPNCVRVISNASSALLSALWYVPVLVCVNVSVALHFHR